MITFSLYCLLIVALAYWSDMVYEQRKDSYVQSYDRRSFNWNGFAHSPASVGIQGRHVVKPSIALANRTFNGVNGVK